MLIRLISLDRWYNTEKAIMRTYLAPLDRCISLIQKHIPKEEITPPNGRYCQDFTTITAQLAQVYLLEGRFEEARVQFSTAIEYEAIEQADEWPKTERALDLLCGLAVVLHRLGDLESSAELYSSAIPLSEKLFGHVDERTVAISNRFKSVSDRREVMLAHHKFALIGATDRKLSENAGNTQAVTNIRESGTADAGPSNVVNEDVSAELRGAAYAGDEGMVRLILGSQTANPNSTDAQNRTALFWAALRGHKAIVKLLVETGQVNIDSKDNYGQTPLSIAALRGHEAVVKLLVETGLVDIDSEDNYGRTPLWWAADQQNEAIVRLLVKMGVKVDLKDSHGGQTPLSQAACVGNEAVVELLLATGQVDINSKNSIGRTPLYLAVRNKREAVVKLLLETGQVDIDAKDNNGQTPLLWATKNKQDAIVKLLLANRPKGVIKRLLTTRSTLT